MKAWWDKLTKTEKAIFVIVIFAAIVGGYIMIERPFKSQKKKWILDETVKNGTNDDRQKMAEILNKASAEEIKDIYEIIRFVEKKEKNPSLVAPAELIKKREAITAKYNIFG